MTQFGPSKRSMKLRASWGVGNAPRSAHVAKTQPDMGLHWQGRKASMPMTPPMTPEVVAFGAEHTDEPASYDLEERVVLLYVGRMYAFLPLALTVELTTRSWEKNLHLLLHAYPHIPSKPKMVFVGDGPARVELEQTCLKKGYDAVFMGHKVGTELAECFASADIFAFPSFTEVRSSTAPGTN